MSDQLLNSLGLTIDPNLPAETSIQLVKTGAQRIQSARYRIEGTDEWITPAEYFKKALLVKMYGKEALQAD